MKHLHRSFYVIVFVACILILSPQKATSQEIGFSYKYRLDLADATEAPKFTSDFLEIEYPATARKNGVLGTVKASATLGPDSKTVNISIAEGLPFGVSEAVKTALEKLKFEPAKRDGKPIPVKMFFEYTITAVYSEYEKEVQKPKITDKPIPVYPEKYRAEKVKGKVEVRAQFNTDGTVKVLGVNSVMPKEFDKASAEATKNIKFEPAVHKKSKQAVSQVMIVVFDFKP